jgi:hypothetical protein
MEYPENIVTAIRGFRRSGWGGYPSFAVTNNRDAEKAKRLIEYAYANL